MSAETQAAKDFGLLIVDKPVGPTSHYIVSVVRSGTGVRKVGHAGTLDPRASGVLVLCLGAATRLSEYLSTASKRYDAVIRFGSSTDTYDADGAFVRQTGKAPALEQIQGALIEFEGEILQTPPPYSAIKVRGRRAYELAREGNPVELEPRQVTIHDLGLVSYDPPDLVLSVESSAGTYIRSLAHDLGEKLSSGAYLTALRRTKSGPFTLEDAIAMQDLEQGFEEGNWERFLRPAAAALPDMPPVEVDAAALDLLRHGHSIPAGPEMAGLAKAIDSEGELIAILEGVAGANLWHPRKVFLS